jgi:ABC-type Na+ efflux pump permease subunit
LLGIELLTNFWVAVITVALAVSFILAVFKGSLLTSWMMISSLQLIAHLPMLSVKLPAHAHYFLVNLLGLVRLNLTSLNASVDDISSQLKEHELLEDPESHFSSAMHASGYRVGLIRNMLFALCLTLVVLLAWAISAMLESICKDQSCQKKRAVSREVSFNNFVVRLLMLGSFELLLCAFINVANQGASGAAS